MSWFAAALVTALAVLALAAQLGRAPQREPLPHTALQRRAWLGLGIGIAALVHLVSLSFTVLVAYGRALRHA